MDYEGILPKGVGRACLWMSIREGVKQWEEIEAIRRRTPLPPPPPPLMELFRSARASWNTSVCLLASRDGRGSFFFHRAGRGGAGRGKAKNHWGVRGKLCGKWGLHNWPGAHSGRTRSHLWLGNVAMTSYVVIEDSVIDQVLTLGRPDQRPAQNENIGFFYWLGPMPPSGRRT